MLTIVIPGEESFDDEREEFIYTNGQILELEHSLLSISKWESLVNRPFLASGNKTVTESIEYIKCMTISKNVKPEVYNRITDGIMHQVMDYIEAPMTATVINNSGGKVNKEVITSELIYYWMVTMNIPFECQKWHLNRLLTLIRVCDFKNQPAKKVNKAEIIQRNKELNDARKKQLGTKG